MEKEPLIVNGKNYPLWSQFVENKDEWIGGMLVDEGDSFDHNFGLTDQIGTKIEDITLTPNGSDSAAFNVVGEGFSCGFDVRYGGITAGKEGWMTFSGYGGHIWRIQKPSKPN